MDYDFLLDGGSSTPKPVAPKIHRTSSRQGEKSSRNLTPSGLDRLLRIGDVLDIVRVSRPTIYRLIGKGEFPKPLKVGAARLWPENEINKWLTDRIEDRDR